MLTVSLKDGVQLENLGCKLPWGANYFELREIGRPEIRKVVGRWGSPTAYHLVWRKATILGGINTTVTTEVRGPRTVLARYYRKRMAYVRNYIDHSKFPTARRAYRWHLSMLTRRLGVPVLTGDYPNEAGFVYPRTEWVFDGCRVTIGINERFMEYCYFGITNIALWEGRKVRRASESQA